MASVREPQREQPEDVLQHVGLAARAAEHDGAKEPFGRVAYVRLQLRPQLLPPLLLHGRRRHVGAGRGG